MDDAPQQAIIEKYREALRAHGVSPEATCNSAAGQAFRFAKLLEIGDLAGRSVLDLGCGIGDLCGAIEARTSDVDYTGVDIVGDSIEVARDLHPNGRFLHRDVLTEGLDEMFDVVFLCAVFNDARPGAHAFMRRLLAWAFEHCRQAMAFNFISTHVNFRDEGLAYHDPLDVLGYCIEELTPKVELHHHYARCDVAVFCSR